MYHHKTPRTDKVQSACVACKSAHAKCSHHRPCTRCVKLGIKCVPRNKKRLSRDHEMDYTTIEVTKRQRIEYAQFPKIQPRLFINTNFEKPVEKKPSLDELLDEDNLRITPLLVSSPCLFESESLISIFSPVAENIPPIAKENPVGNPGLPAEAEHQYSTSGLIVAMSHELPNFKIWSPNLKEKLGYSNEDVGIMSLENIFEKHEVDQLLQHLEKESEQRKLLHQVSGNDSVFKHCLETSFVEKRSLKKKNGERLECVIKFSKNFARHDPSKLESFAMYVFWN